MRNLKRALSAALASVMVLGLMVVGASAASYDKFSDKADIVNKDAVSMVTELGIIAGLPDGSYGPEQNIDRASFARLICVMLNGGKEPMLGNVGTTFTDTQGHWAEKYIAYCVNLNIIAGKGNNTFAPAANVTGSEAAKMLLVSLGYVPANEGIGGVTWQIATDVLANQAGLYDSLEGMNTSAALTRDQAAQMIYNALNATMVKYEDGKAVSQTTSGYTWISKTDDNGTTWQAVPSTVDKTMLKAKFGVEKFEGILTATDKVALDGASAAKEGYCKVNGVSVKTTATMDLLGQYVSVYVKSSSLKSGVYEDVYGTVVVDPENVVTMNYDGGDSFKVGKNTYTVGGDGVRAYKNLAAWTKGGVGAGTPVAIIENADESVYILATSYTFAKVNKVDTKKETVTIDGVVKAIDNDNILCDTGLEKDDMVLYYTVGDDYVVTLADTVTGKLTGTSNGKAVIDGAKYSFSEGIENAITKDELVTSGNSNVEKTFYVFDGYVLGVKDAVKSVDKFAVVVGYKFKAENSTLEGDSTVTAQVKVVLDDGTSAIYDVAKITNDKAVYSFDNDTSEKNASEDAFKGALGIAKDSTKAAEVLYSYSVNSKGKISLTKYVSDDDATVKTISDGEKFTAGDNKLGAKNDKVYVDADTIFFVKKDDGYKVYTGTKNAPSMAAGYAGSAVTVENVANAVLLTTSSAATSADELAYVVSLDKTYNSDDEEVYTVTLFNGEEKSYETTADFDADLVGTVISYTITDGKVDDDAAEADAKYDEVKTVNTDAGFITVDSKDGEPKDYDLASDVAVYTVDKDGNVDEGTLTTTDAGDYNIFVATNDDGEAIAVYYVEVEQ